MLDFAQMLDWDDFHWMGLDGGYRMRFDPRLLLMKLESGESSAAIWDSLWDELHHQGDVGEASYASVPHLVRIYRNSSRIEWNTYAIIAIIELARNAGGNPDVPEWLKDDYFSAIRQLAETGMEQVLHAKDPETIRAILSVLAIERGLRHCGKILINYSEDELLEIASQLRAPRNAAVPSSANRLDRRI
jgi:hypothetical protein